MTPAAESSRPEGSTKLDVRWWGTLLFVPVLYGVGWLLSRPLLVLAPGLRPDQVDLCGAILALLLLLFSLPQRLKQVWQESRPWRRLGVMGTPGACLASLIRGLVTALSLLLVLVVVTLLTGMGQWAGGLNIGTLFNAIALAAGVGFAEELLFRGWLWGELSLRLSPTTAIGLQAAVFALLHPWYQQKGLAAAGLLAGCTLLGLALALQRQRERGLLWGSIGLHGGLVGGIFLIQNGLMQISANAPAWLLGSGAPQANPIGGMVGLSAMASLIWIQHHVWSNPQRAAQDESMPCP